MLVEGEGPSSGTQELPDGSVGVVVPIQYVDVIHALHKAAKGGDVQAARELRAWKAEHPLVDDEVKLEEQPAVIRKRLLKRLLAELGEEDGQPAQGRGLPTKSL